MRKNNCRILGPSQQLKIETGMFINVLYQHLQQMIHFRCQTKQKELTSDSTPPFCILQIRPNYGIIISHPYGYQNLVFYCHPVHTSPPPPKQKEKRYQIFSNNRLCHQPHECLLKQNLKDRHISIWTSNRLLFKILKNFEKKLLVPRKMG